MDSSVLSSLSMTSFLYPVMLKCSKQRKNSLCREFEMVVDLGEIHFILGMTIKRGRATRTLTISQGQYLRDLLKRFGMEECKPMSTPLESGKKFHKRTDEEERCDKSIYQQATRVPRLCINCYETRHCCGCCNFITIYV